MRLYYMTSHRILTEHILPERRMKLSQFHELNDPFELKPYVLSDKDLRRINRALEINYFGNKGILCFSDNWKSPVMWAHYADKHYGVCLGFDIPDLDGEPLPHPVNYNLGRLRFMLDHEKELFGIDQKFVQSLLYTKSGEWSYEREWRVVADLKIKDEKTGFYYADFGPHLQLREVFWAQEIRHRSGKWPSWSERTQRQCRSSKLDLRSKSSPSSETNRSLRSMSRLA